MIHLDGVPVELRPLTPPLRGPEPDFEVTYSIFKKYDFDEETPLRYALDVITAGKR
jgi:hypothetical protein